MNSDRNYSFWKQYPGLVWSNPHASDSVMIMAALMRPRLEQLTSIAEEFGFDRVLAEWELLQEEDLKPIHVEMVAEMLSEIEERVTHASGRYRSSLGRSLATA